ncbi:MAG TPA: glycosyltransferase family 4 protein [Thermoanaerobaculia bacterium]|jgi:glycosyltransferase involved in cell wall biosynthesis
MKLLMIHQAFVSLEEAGGTRHVEFASHLVATGHEVAIVGPSHSYRTAERARVSGNVNGIQVIRAYTAPTMHKSFAWRLLSFGTFMLSSVLASLRSGKPDVILGTSPPIFQAVSAWLVAALWRRPFLLEIRDLWPEFAVDIGILKNKRLIKAAYALENFLYRRADRIIVNSPAYVTYLLSRGVPERKVELISNGVDPKMFDGPARREEVRRQYGIGDEFLVMYAGALGVANDIPTLLQAAKLLQERKDIRFAIVGDGMKRADLEREAGELGLTNLRFYDSVPKTEMKDVLAAADACVAILKNIPMFRTTYPNKVFDYMAARRPVVLAIDGVIREVVEQGNCGVFAQPGDPQALAAAVRTLADDRERAAQLGLNGRDYVCRHFDRRQHAEQFRLVVESMSAKGR